MKARWRWLQLGLVCCVLATGGMVLGHGGGLDSSGGHHDRKAGGYHFHRGPLAGQSFASKAAALNALLAYYERQKQPAETPPATEPPVPAEPALPAEDDVRPAKVGETVEVLKRLLIEEEIITEQQFLGELIELREERDRRKSDRGS